MKNENNEEFGVGVLFLGCCVIPLAITFGVWIWAIIKLVTKYF